MCFRKKILEISYKTGMVKYLNIRLFFLNYFILSEQIILNICALLKGSRQDTVWYSTCLERIFAFFQKPPGKRWDLIISNLRYVLYKAALFALSFDHRLLVVREIPLCSRIMRISAFIVPWYHSVYMWMCTFKCTTCIRNQFYIVKILRPPTYSVMTLWNSSSCTGCKCSLLSPDQSGITATADTDRKVTKKHPVHNVRSVVVNRKQSPAQQKGAPCTHIHKLIQKLSSSTMPWGPTL